MKSTAFGRIERARNLTFQDDPVLLFRRDFRDRGDERLGVGMKGPLKEIIPLR